MDSQRIDKADPRVTFDLVREWGSRCFGRRSTHRGNPEGGSWRALVLALRHAGVDQPEDGVVGGPASASQDPADLLQRERELRRTLVAVYHQQTPETVDEILSAKLREESSYFALAGYTRERAKARHHWNWYLYCLTFAEEEELPSADIVRMPLDLVDVQAVAMGFQAQITVTRLMSEAQRLRPPAESPPARYAAHLVAHEGRWSSLLGPRGPDEENVRLRGSVVELGDLPPGPLEQANRHTGAVLDYDKECEAYVVVRGLKQLLVERSQIAQVLFHPKDKEDQSGNDAAAASLARTGAYGPGTAPPFRGIPDAAIEFQVLHEIVRTVARQRLNCMKMELSGRSQDAAPTDGGVGERPARPLKRFEPVPKAAHQAIEPSAVAVPKSGQPSAVALAEDVPENGQEEAQAIQRWSLEHVHGQLAENRQVVIIAPSSCRTSDSSQLNLDVGVELVLKQRHEQCIWTRRTDTGMEGWCPVDRLTVWNVLKPFPVDKSWPSADSYLGLQMQDLVLVRHQYDGEWHGWGFGTLWGVEEREGVKHEGVFPLSHVQPLMLIKRVNPP